MRGPSTIICALPANCWAAEGKSHPAAANLAPLLDDVAVLERRIQTGVNLEDERRRYQTVLQRIQSLALGNAYLSQTYLEFRTARSNGVFPAMRVGIVYTDLLRETLVRAPSDNDAVGYSAIGRLGARVVPPDKLREHISAFRRVSQELGYSGYFDISERLRFLRFSVGCGIVEIHDALTMPLDPRRDEAIPSPPDDASAVGFFGRLLGERRQKGATTLASPAARRRLPCPLRDDRTDGTDWRSYGEQPGRDFIRERLCAQLIEALTGRTAVNMGSQGHIEATEALNKFILLSKKYKPGEVRITYDGAEAAPFPLCCLHPLPSGWEHTCKLNVALISMRHFPLDPYIHFNWFRNLEVPSKGTLAESDAFCFDVSLSQFNQLRELYAGERLQLNLYHTGFPPAVIAFYRALVHTLKEDGSSAHWLKVIPKLKPQQDCEYEYECGNPWPRSQNGKAVDN